MEAIDQPVTHAEFRAAVLAAFGTDSEAVALGKLAAGQDALATAASLRVELDGERQHTRKRAVKEALHAALHATPARINLGEIQRVIPTLLGSGRAEAMAALGKVEKQEGIPLVEALLSVPLSQDATDSVLAYLDARGPVHQAVEREPAPAATDPDDTDPVAMRIRAVAAETNKHFNLTAPATAAAK